MGKQRTKELNDSLKAFWVLNRTVEVKPNWINDFILFSSVISGFF